MWLVRNLCDWNECNHHAHLCIKICKRTIYIAEVFVECDRRSELLYYSNTIAIKNHSYILYSPFKGKIIITKVGFEPTVFFDQWCHSLHYKALYFHEIFGFFIVNFYFEIKSSSLFGMRKIMRFESNVWHDRACTL